MHGVTEKLPVGQFVGATLVGFRPLENIAYFAFERPHSRLPFGSARPLSIGVEANWQLRGSDGALVAQGNPIPEHGSAAIQTLFGQAIVAASVNVPESFVLEFASGHLLEVFDSNRQYESFSIPESNVYV